MKRLVLAASLIAGLVACGQSAEVGVDQAWARDTVGRTANAAVFMTISSPTADRLVGASTPVAGKTGLMTMEMDGGAMTMAYVDAIDVPANEAVSLDPSGLHVWLEDLREPLKSGQTFPLVLEFEKAGEKHVEVSVVPPAAPSPMQDM
jgi:copper(I)-binding protein